MPLKSTVRRMLLDVGRPGRPLADALQVRRILTADDRVLPDFLIIGAQRGGTTSLYNYLGEHPLVCPSYRKEVHFFDYNFDKGLRWYRSHFPRREEMETSGGRRVTGESSPYYIFHPLAAERARATVPDVRLIALLRDPVERAISHYYMSRRDGFETASLEDALEREVKLLESGSEDEADWLRFNGSHSRQSYLRRGIYADQLARWKGQFPGEQLLVLRSEDLFANPAATIAIVQSFLGLPTQPLVDARPFNEGVRDAEADGGVRQWLREFYRPHNQRLEILMGRRFKWG
jgi:Sulfotransferase domain